MSIPATVPVFTDLQDDIDFILAADQNDPNDEITSMATLHGMLGAGLVQGQSLDTLTFIQRARSSIRIAWTDVDTVTASIGEIMCLNSGGSKRMMRKNTSTTAITFANIDTGARALSTTYYVWAIADAVATTVTFKVSTSASAPTGATYYALVGKFSTNASGAGEIISSSVSSYVGDQLVNANYTQVVALATGTTAVPYDDTIPTILEGDEYMTLVHTPQDALNILEINVIFNGGNSGSQDFFVGIWQDATSACLNGSFKKTASGDFAGSFNPFPIKHIMLAGTVNATTFRVRAGGSTGSTTTINGETGARKYGGILTSSISIKEYRRVYA